MEGKVCCFIGHRKIDNGVELTQRVEETIRDFIIPDCPISGKCGGCVYRHVSIEHEKALKEQAVEKLLRQAGVNAGVLPLITPVTDRYRNKVQYPTQNGKAGYYRQNSHTIVPCDDCLLQPEIFSKITACVMAFVTKHGISCYDEESGKGLLRHIYLRGNNDHSEILLTLVVKEEKFPHKDLPKCTERSGSNKYI